MFEIGPSLSVYLEGMGILLLSSPVGNKDFPPCLITHQATLDWHLKYYCIALMVFPINDCKDVFIQNILSRILILVSKVRLGDR